MSSEERKVQLGVAVDATGAKQGFEEVKQAARDMAQAVGQSGVEAGKGLDGIGAGAGPASQKFDGATRGIIAAIQRTTAVMEAGGRTTAKYYEALAAQRGVSVDALKPYLDQLEAVTAKQGIATGALQAGATGLNAVGLSAKQTAFAMRGVPAQFTDIVTSLQAGQRPMQVFLQQGGQLKDMFGGIGPAARALGGYLLGLVNPVTLAIGAVGGLAFVMVQGAKELTGFQNAATIAGNAMGVSASQFAQLRDSISGISGTKGKAAEVLTEIASKGTLAGGSIRSIGEAAVLMEKATGQATAKTIDQFAELAKAPADAAAKLNEQYHFLTAAVYQQIKALEDQGRTVDAANLAEETYATALKARAQEVINNAGFIEKAWLGIAGVAKAAWDAMLNVGRAATPADQLTKAAQDVARIQAQIAGVGAFATTGGGAAVGGASAARRAALEQELAVANDVLQAAQRRVEVEARNTQAKAEQNRLDALGIDFAKQGEAFLTKQERLTRELNRARVEGEQLVAAGLLKQSELEARLSNIRDKFKESGGGARGKALDEEARLLAELSGLSADYTKKLNLLQEARAKGNLSEERYVEFVNALIMKQPMVKAMTDAAAKAAQDEAKARAEAANEFEKYLDSLEKGTDKIQEQTAKQLEHNAALGLSKEAVAALEAAKLDDAAASKERLATEIEERDGDLRLAQGYRDQAKALRELSAAKRDGGAKQTQLDIDKASEQAAKKAEEEWKRAAESINNSLTDALLRGFESGKGFAQNFRDTLKNMFSTLVLRPIISAVMSPISQGINAFLGGGGSGGSGIFNTASSAYNLYNGGSSLATVGSQVFGGTMSVANGAGTLYANATGSGLDGLLATNGAYGTAANSSASSLASAIGPFTAIAGVLLVAYQQGFFSGEKRSGGRFATDASGQAQLIEGPSGGVTDPAASKGLIDATVAGINEAFSVLGFTDRIAGFQGAFETSPNGSGRGGVYSGGTLTSGKTFGESGVGNNYDWMNSPFELIGDGLNRYLKTEGEATKEFALDLKQSMLEALQAVAGIAPTTILRTWQEELGGGDEFAKTLIDKSGLFRVFDDAALAAADAAGVLPKKILDLIKGVDFEAKAEPEVDRVLGLINTMIGAVKGFRAAVELFPVEQLKSFSFDAAAGLVELSGGLETFTSNLASYSANFYSEEEKRKNTADNISKALGSAGLNFNAEQILSATREQFRGLMDEFLEMGEVGRPMVAALLSVNEAFASITPAAGDAGDATLQLTETLDEAIARLRNPIRTVQDIAQSILGLQKTTSSLQVELLRAKGNTDAAKVLQREIDISGLSEAEVAIYDYNQALRDQIDAINKAASDAAAASARRSEAAAKRKAIASEREQLERQLLQLEGNTAELRRRQLLDLDRSNRALQTQIWALQDQQEAAEALKQVWSGVTDSIMDEVKRLRGLLEGDSGQSFAKAQTAFAIATAQARSGDVEAAKKLPGLSQTLSGLALDNSSSMLEFQRIIAATANSLEVTGSQLTSQFELDVTPMVDQLQSLNTVSRDMALTLRNIDRRFDAWDGDGMPEQRETT